MRFEYWGFWNWVFIIFVVGLVVSLIREMKFHERNFRENLEYIDSNWPGLLTLIVLVSLFVAYCSPEDELAKFERAGQPTENIPGQTDVIGESYNLCSTIKRANLVISCDTNINFGRKNSIDVVVDTNSTEAQKMCFGLQQLIPSGSKFNGEWELRIVSPYSGGNPIATCTLW